MKSLKQPIFRVNDFFSVAEGVARTRYDADPPSPAARAAHAFNEALHRFLSDLHEPPTLTTLHQAAREGNHAVEEVNRALGLWEDHDYYERDYAGTVAAAIVLTPPTFLYGFMTDCGIVHLANGRHPFATPDTLARVRRNFPGGDGPERTIRIRRDYRNRPHASHPTYGVFTGEVTALDYWNMGQREYLPGDTLLVFSDGARPAVIHPEFQRLVAQQKDDELRDFVAVHNLLGDDEATLIIIRP